MNVYLFNWSHAEYDYELQILTMYDALDMVNTEKVVEFVVSLQQEDGSFYGDKWGTLLITVVFCIEQYM